MNRESIFAALFTLASGAPGLVTKERKLRPFTAYQPSQQPVLNVAHGDEEAIPLMGGGPTKWVFKPELFFYIWNGDQSGIPDTKVNAVLDYVTQKFNPDPSTADDLKQTLGGLVEEARISGTIRVAEVEDIPQLIVVVPLEIIAAA